MRTGRLAADIARSEKADRNVIGVAMIGGMLHDIGKMILLKMPRKYNEVMELVKTTDCSFAEAEYTVMGASHTELGAYLLGLWGLPCDVIETVAFHHNPSKLIEGMSITPNESTKGDPDKTESKDVDSESQSEEEKSNELIALTSVHIANALSMQENCSPDTPCQYVDMSYLKKLGLADKLPEWIELYNNTKPLSEVNLQFS